MQISKSSFEMLSLVADEILEAAEIPEDVLERTTVRVFEERGFNTDMFYRIGACDDGFIHHVAA